MPVYVMRGGQLVDKRTGEPVKSEPYRPVAPAVVSDLPGYRSPIDGRWVEGRRARRYDLESNDCVPYEPDTSKRTPGVFKNERFASKWRLPHD